MLLEKHKTVIMDFSEKGMEKAFAWISEGVSYSIQDSMRFYQNLKPPSDLIRDWLANNRKNLTGKALTSANRGEFHPRVSKIIAMLSRVIGQKDDTKFRPEFIGFIELISIDKDIR